MGPETFLIFANFYEKNTKPNYETYSILYKFVDDYFVPFQGFFLNGVIEWLPVQGHNEFVLFSNSIFGGLQAFQYNGWIFVESHVKLPFTALKKGIKSLRINPYNKTSIVVSNKNNNGNNPNVFGLVFSHQNTLKKIQNDLMAWCRQSEERVQSLDLNLLGQRSDTIPKISPNEHKAIIDRLEEIGSDESDYYDDDDETITKNITTLDLATIDSKLAALDSAFREVEENLQKPQKFSNLVAETVIVEEAVFDSLQTEKINRVHIGAVLGNTFDVNKGFTVNSMKFSDLHVEGNDHPPKINGKPTNSLLKNDTAINLNHLVINGNITVNNTKLGKFNSLLLNKDQKIDDFHINSLQTENVKAKTLNHFGWKKIQKIGKVQIDNLNVENLTMGGVLNGIHVPTLEKYSLKTSGNQEIIAPYFFDNLKAPNLNISLINNRNVQDLIYVNEGTYEMDQDMVFKNDLVINNLTVLHLLNNWEIINKQVQILYNNRNEAQYVTGEKIFENAQIENSIKLSGNIRSKELERINPVRTIEQDLLLKDDIVVTGNVKVNNFLKINDLITKSQRFSLKKLKNNAVKLTDRKINPKLVFNQQIITDDVKTDQINDFNPENYVTIGDETTQVIKGTKIFFGDLLVEGDTNVARINNIDLDALNVLLKDSDQNITGKPHVKRIVAENVRVKSVNFNGKPLENIVRTDGNQKISGNNVINGDVVIQNLTANHVFIKGLVNSKKFTEIVKNTVKSSKFRIKSPKVFRNLTVEQVFLKSGNMRKIQELLDFKGGLVVNTSVIGENSVENLTFTHSCNGIPKENFWNSQMDKNGNQLINGNHDFDIMRIKGRIFIESGKINGISLREIRENTVKINETHVFQSVTINPTIISKQPIVVKGHIENLDLDNLITQNSLVEQQIDSKFLKNVTINGNVTFKGLINDVNLTDLKNFAENPENLLIEGNVYFTKGPNVLFVNNKSLSDILENSWFQDEDTTLKGHAEFDQLVFEEDVSVGGFVDNVSLKLLSDNYLSKSKNQTIPAQLDFQNVIFEKNISVPDIELTYLNNIRLEQLVRTALLDGVDQIFESTAFFESFHAKKLQGEYLVNDLDLENDVLRYDKPNLVTGLKTFTDLSVGVLKNASESLKIQDVDILDWFHKSLLKIGTFNVTGPKLFNNVTFAKGLQADLVNGQSFNEKTVMLRNVPQNVTGLKEMHKSVHFKSIKLKKLLNGIDLSKLINNQAVKNGNNTFKTELTFSNNITTKNLTINKFFHNINVTELINNITSLNTVNIFLDKYNKLMEMSSKIKESLMSQAYFMDYYKVTQKINNVDDILQVTGEDGIDRLVTFTKTATKTEVHLHKWHESYLNFTLENTKTLPGTPFYADKIFNQLYIEFENYGTPNIGKLYKTDNLSEVFKFSINSTKFTETFTNPVTNENCILFLQYWYQPKIFCLTDHYYLKQVLDSPPGFKATSMTVNGNLFLIIIDREESDSYLITWKLNNATNLFEMHQIIYETQPNSLSVVQFRNTHYLAVASGKLENAMYTGMVHILRFDEKLDQFLSFQMLDLSTPIQVEFAVLPTQELILYVITDNPIEPLVVYRYEGISGFRKKISATALMKSRSFVQFTLNSNENRHFVIAKDYDRPQISVIEAIFKGASSGIAQN